MGDKGVQKSVGVHTEESGEGVGPFEGEDQHGFSPDVGEASDEVKQGGTRAFEGRDTQDASKSEDGGTEAPVKAAEKVGDSITTQGNERALGEDEAGRKGAEEHEAGRERGGSDARFATSVDPKGAESGEESPNLSPGDQGG